MVTTKKLTIFLFLLAMIPIHLFCQEVKVTSEIEGEGVVGIPLKGTITITHERNLKVDENSFLLGSIPLKVEFIKEVQLSRGSPLIISIYSFTLDPKTAGPQVLPEITARVGGKGYQSISRTYMVKKTAEPTTTGGSGDIVILRFETIVDGPTTLYPGQRLTVGYRFIFNYSLDLTKEEIPLLEGKGFRKIGGKEAEDYSKNNLNYLEATQVLEAIKPGEYTFRPGIIEGRGYRMNRLGKKEYANAPSHAESAPLTIRVLPFPEVGKPTSFNGAIGESFHFDVSLLTPREMTVGDKAELLIKISGKGELANIPLPTVCCQPGYSGFFRLSDLPPVEKLEQSSKTFKVEMRPLTAEISEIPSLEFSYFNPKTEKYASLQSKPIPIKVHPLKTKPGDITPYTPAIGTEGQTEEKSGTPKAIEIEGIFLIFARDLENLTFGTWKVLFILPFGIAAFFLQVHVRRYLLRQRQKVKPVKSQDLFKEAIKQTPGTSQFFNLLQAAFLTRLVERGEISTTKIPTDKIPNNGIAGKVRAFLYEIEIQRFSGREEAFGKPIIKQAKKLFSELE